MGSTTVLQQLMPGNGNGGNGCGFGTQSRRTKRGHQCARGFCFGNFGFGESSFGTNQEHCSVSAVLLQGLVQSLLPDPLLVAKNQ